MVYTRTTFYIKSVSSTGIHRINRNSPQQPGFRSWLTFFYRSLSSRCQEQLFHWSVLLDKGKKSWSFSRQSCLFNSALFSLSLFLQDLSGKLSHVLFGYLFFLKRIIKSLYFVIEGKCVIFYGPKT